AIADVSPAGGGRGGRGGAQTQNTTPMATPLKLSPWDPNKTGTPFGYATSLGNDFNVVEPGQTAGSGGRGGRGGGGGGRRFRGWLRRRRRSGDRRGAVG